LSEVSESPQVHSFFILLIRVVFSNSTMLSVSGTSESGNELTHTGQQKINKIPYSRGSPEVPMNILDSWLIMTRWRFMLGQFTCVHSCV